MEAEDDDDEDEEDIPIEEVGRETDDACRFLKLELVVNILVV